MRVKGRRNRPISWGVGGQVGGLEREKRGTGENARREVVCWQAQNLTTFGLLFLRQSQIAAGGRRSGRGLSRAKCRLVLRSAVTLVT